MEVAGCRMGLLDVSNEAGIVIPHASQPAQSPRSSCLPPHAETSAGNNSSYDFLKYAKTMEEWLLLSLVPESLASVDDPDLSSQGII
jgi:hypothetical protein